MPPKYILVGARRWLQLLQTSSTASAMAIFMSQPEFADLTASNYRESHEWLESHGLLSEVSEFVGQLDPRAFVAALKDESLTWLRDGLAGIPSPDFLPEPVLAAAEQLGLERTVAWQVALDLGRKVDLERQSRIGSLGETAVVRHVESLSMTAEHLSLRSDALGWDIRVVSDDAEGHLEVKSTTSLSQLRVFLSRNEYEVSRRDPMWGLTIALINETGVLLRIAHVPTEIIHELVPTDKGAVGRWQSCALHLTGIHLRRGLPAQISMPGDSGVISVTTEPDWWPQQV
jgi:hypothetical protein